MTLTSKLVRAHGVDDHRVTNFRSLFACISAASDPLPSIGSRFGTTYYYAAVDAHPVLARLPKDLALFSYAYLKVILGLPGALGPASAR